MQRAREQCVKSTSYFLPYKGANRKSHLGCVMHQLLETRSPATAGKANRPLLFLEHRIPMPELFTELRFSILREFWTQEIRLPLLGGDAPRLG